MKINRETIAHLEKLARIQLRPDEVDEVTEQLDGIVGFVEQIAEADCAGVPPTRGLSFADQTTLRPDKREPSLDREVVLEQAPDHTKVFFRVPSVIDRGESS